MSRSGRALRVLAPGGDLMGLVVAATRVYVNEGSGYKDCIPTWALNLYDLKGSQERSFKQSEFEILSKILRKDPEEPLDADRGRDAETSEAFFTCCTHDGFALG